MFHVKLYASKLIVGSGCNWMNRRFRQRNPQRLTVRALGILKIICPPLKIAVRIVYTEEALLAWGKG